MTRPRRDRQPDPDHAPDKVRLQRFLADAGVAARRACERLIEEGRVRVNGERVTRLPVFIDPATDRVEVDGVGVRETQRLLYVMLNKPAGVLVANFDEPGFDRTTVAHLVSHPSGSRLFPVGRLDMETTGLVLLTNDGELANRLTHPRYGIEKTYEVTVRGSLDQAAIDAVRLKFRAASRRADVESGSTRSLRHDPAPDIAIHKREKDKTVLRVTLKEARNRQLRDVLAHLGMPVKKLERVAIGTLELSGVASGQWRELSRDEISTLKRSRSARPAKQSNQHARPRHQAPEPARTNDPPGLEPARTSAPATRRSEKPTKARVGPAPRPMNSPPARSVAKPQAPREDVSRVRPRVIG